MWIHARLKNISHICTTSCEDTGKEKRDLPSRCTSPPVSATTPSLPNQFACSSAKCLAISLSLFHPILLLTVKHPYLQADIPRRGLRSRPGLRLHPPLRRRERMLKHKAEKDVDVYGVIDGADIGCKGKRRANAFLANGKLQIKEGGGRSIRGIGSDI